MKAKAENKKKALKDGDFQYGAVEMTDEEYAQAQDPKIRTTIFLDASLIRAYKKEATKKGLKYQQLMRDILRKSLIETQDLAERVTRLEDIVLKKRA
ncbi:MAG: hypothetical protein AB1540_07645 [Bdellovibrionota bacterium]